MRQINLILIFSVFSFYGRTQKVVIKYLAEEQIKFFATNELFINDAINLNNNSIFTKEVGIPLLYENAKYKTVLILFPNDTLTIKFENKELKIHCINNSIRNNEIECTKNLRENFGEFIFENFDDIDRVPFVKDNTNKQSQIVDEKYFKAFGKHLRTSPQSNSKRDSMIYAIFKQRIESINNFRNKKEISQEYVNLITRWLLYRYLYLSIKGFANSVDDKLTPKLDSILASKSIFDDVYIKNINTYRAFIFYYNNYLTSKRLNRASSSKEKFLNADTTFKGITKDRIMFAIVYEELLKQIKNDELVALFFQKCKNKEYIERVNDLLSTQTFTINSNFDIINIKDEHTSLSSIIENNKGNLIYIDFWASWCNPCIIEMENYPQIFNANSNKAIKFVFISLDKDKGNWMKTYSSFSGLFPQNNSFILLENFNSPFAKQYKIFTIPRYMLIGKDGKIINADAPRPSDPKLKELIEKHLKD